MEIKKLNVTDGILYIGFEGRIDSNNAGEVSDKVDEIIKTEHETVVIDADKLEYISSAGLRVLLKLRKMYPKLRVINTSSDVYEIFDVTGFTEMIKVEKAYRVLSVEGCEVIGQGANGKVYRLDPDTIIKVYFNPDSLPDIHRERELARRAFVLGIPTAIPYDVVKVGEGYGSVFELLNAKSFAKLIKEEPENVDKYVNLSVELLKKIHSTEVKPDDMPDMKETVIGWANYVKDHLPEGYGDKLLSLIKAVPDSLGMIHGDYHIKNVMMQQGETLLIDMDTLCHGHPVFELGSVYNAYCGFSEVDNSISLEFLGIPHETAVSIWEKTIPLYLETDDEAKITEVREKAMLIGYLRLYRRNIKRKIFEQSELGRTEMETYKKHLIELIDKIDDLTF